MTDEALRAFRGITVLGFDVVRSSHGFFPNFLAEVTEEDVVEEAVARQLKAFSISEIEAESPGVSRDWVRLVLRRLRDEGKIRLIGRGRGAKWVRVEQ